MDLLEKLRGGLVVSCQPVDGGPLDRPEIVAALAEAAVAGGAAGLRIEGIRNLEAVRPRVAVPVIGIVKRDLESSPVRITPLNADARALIAAGADIVAVDATDRPPPHPPPPAPRAPPASGALAMADCATPADGSRALAAGAAILGTTLSGYTAETAGQGDGVDLELIGSFRALGGFVMAEGRINTPALAAAAIQAGADAVTVGTALTRLELATGWFATAIAAAGRR